MKTSRRIFALILAICIVFGGITPLTMFDTVNAETLTTVKISSDDTFSYVDSDNSNTVNTGDILYVVKEGLYVWDTPSNIDSTTDKVKTITVKKVNTSTYLQDDNASSFYAINYENGFNTIMGHTNNYAHKLTTDYGYTFEGTRFSKYNMNAVKNTDWAYEFNWWSAFHNNTYNFNSSALVKTDKSFIENAYGNAYCRPGVQVQVSYIKRARDAMYNATITSDNGRVELLTEANKVTINPIADNGYELDKLQVVDSDGNPIILTNNKFVMPAKDISIKATFKTIEYTISFNDNDGKIIDEQKTKLGDVITNPIVPTKKGYIFSGWYSDQEYIMKYDFNVPVESDIDLYAKWEICNHENSNVKANCKGVVSCSLCGGDIATIEHNYTKVKHDAEGHWYTCVDCDELQKDSKVSHLFNWIIDLNPTENSDGLKHEECACGEKRNENTIIQATNKNVDSSTTIKDDINYVTSPKTGDENNVVVYFILLFICCGCGAYLIGCKKRN